MRVNNIAFGALLICSAAAHAQSTVTIYGALDQYLNFMKSSSGTRIVAMEDGSTLRSRLGFRGVEDLGDGLQAKFQLEMGFSTDTGGTADGTRAFDRQSWVGLAGRLGEVRFGRQNTALFYRGDYIDFTSRTLGSVVNAVGVPSRFDNDIAYLSPRMNGFMGEVHYALAETTAGFGNQAIYQAALDYENGPFRVGYAGLMGKPPSNALVKQNVRYDNIYANYNYGKGRLYAAYVKTNNSTASGGINNAGTLLGNVGGLVAGTNPDASTFYAISQLSADYRISELLRIGALVGRISDQSGGGKNANGFGLGAYYDLSKRTTLIALVNSLRNGQNAGFRPSGSAAPKSTFAAGADVNGQTINGIQLGIVHRF